MVLTGIELALAVAPLLLATAATFQAMRETTRTLSRQKSKDDKLADFLASLHAELALLNLTLRSLVSDLPTISEEQKDKLLQHDRAEWRDPIVESALKGRLGDADEAFQDILNTILKFLDDVISDKSLGLVSTDIVSRPLHQLSLLDD